ncbi:unnamed protein product [Toxocara canis]|uniref:Uncharacterized protein n=1 Tax=Toxocara canis TaxID=6265 RepID=A0A3P7GY38_TOXCA|nr:unnamed protein product [Toxocara canis]
MVAARVHICYLIRSLLNADAIINERIFERRDSLSANGSVIPNEHMNVLYEILLDRHVDVSASVRSEVLKGISIIQDESHDFFSRQRANDQSTPLEILRRHFRDESSDCQLVAVKTISVVAKEEIELMVEMALGNAETKVLRAALSRLAKDVDLKALSITQRMELLKSMMLSGEPVIQSDALNEMLSEWLDEASGRDSVSEEDSVWDTAEYCFAPARLLRFLEPLNEEKTAHDLMVIAFRRCRKNLLMQNAEVHEFVKTLTVLEQANAVFIWRCMLDFCKSESTSEADWIECRYRLLPTLHTFCDFVTK